jgi:hypothetical protein
MSQLHPPPGAPPGPGWYEIRIQGHLASRWVAWFDGLTLTHQADGTTLIHGLIVDQSALHGLLLKVRDLGLPLISVVPVGSDHPGFPAPSLPDSATTKDLT